MGPAACSMLCGLHGEPMGGKETKGGERNATYTHTMAVVVDSVRRHKIEPFFNSARSSVRESCFPSPNTSFLAVGGIFGNVVSLPPPPPSPRRQQRREKEQRFPFQRITGGGSTSAKSFFSLRAAPKYWAARGSVQEKGKRMRG